MKTSLLEKARNSGKFGKIRHQYTKEEVDLIMAWVEGEVNLTQVALALGQNGTGNVYAFLALGLKHFILSQKED